MSRISTKPEVTGIFIPSETVLFSYNGTEYSHTGDAVLTTILTYTVPGGLMSPNDSIEIEHFWTFTGNTETRTCYVYANGTDLVVNKAGQASTTDAFQSKAIFRNNNSTSAQILMHPTIQTVYEFTGTVPVEYTIDTTSDVVFTFQAQLGTDGSDTITLSGVKISHVKATGVAG